MHLLIQKIRVSPLSIPLALLAACVLAFGLLIPWLGFYYDDWHFIYYASRGTQGLIDIFNYDGHPMSVWTYILAFKLLGYDPLLWHLTSLIWRWLAVTIFWLCLKRLWPKYDRQTFTAALLFAIYPLFTLQALPISYVEVWMSFFVLGLSFFLTLEAMRRPDKFWLFTTLAILVKIAHAFTSEYTWGTELMRPFLIWFMLPQKLSLKEKLLETFKIWLPYLVIFTMMIGWRAFLYQGGRKAFQAQTGLLTNPLEALALIIRFTIPDLGLILFSSWYPVFAPKYIDMGERINILLLILMAASGAGLFAFLRKVSAPDDETSAENGSWARQALIIGFSGLVFGLIPAYGAGYSIHLIEVPINARLALGAVPGAALILAALLEIVVTRQRTRLVLIAVLAGLLIGWHVRYTNDFRWAWMAQVSFYRQLTWRIPGMAANTALITNESIFPSINEFPALVAVEGDFPTALAINVIYGAGPQSNGRLPYWFFPTLDILQRPQLSGEHVDAHFSGARQQSLLFSFVPENGECLHILRAQDAAYRRLPEDLKTAAVSASLTAIDGNAQTDFSTLSKILGPENTESWCYFYQKADLARQKQAWSAIPSLWDSASQKDLRPGDGREYIPFAEAYARLNRWDKALELTRAAGKLTPNMGDVYCSLWKELADETPPADEKDAALKTAQNLLKCAAP